MTIKEWKEDFESFVNELDMPRDDYNGIMEYIYDGYALLKEQESVVRCKDCKHRPKKPYGFDIEFPEGSKCPCQCSDDEYYSWYPEDDWYCANGERR